MRITWVTRSFLDYRIPVYAELDKLCGNQLTLIYNSEVVPERCRKRIHDILGERSIALSGEKRLTGEKSAPISTPKRHGIRIPMQPGLIESCKASQPDVCISDGFFQWTYAPLWMRIFHHVPHVMCYESTKHTERNAQFFRTWYRRMASHWIDAICCNGSLCVEYCRDVLHIPDRKLSTGQMAADTEQLAAACQTITEEQIKTFRERHSLKGTVYLFVGRLVELKGLHQLLDAWKEANLQDATLLIAGDGPQRQELEEFSQQNNLSVVFAGNVDYTQIAIYYRAANVFIIPTLQDNWSLVVPEAMACGLPIACSKLNGCWPELVKPENGWVFDPLDKENTIRMLRTISTLNTRELQTMGQCSCQIVEAYSSVRAAQTIFESCEYAIRHGGR